MDKAISLRGLFLSIIVPDISSFFTRAEMSLIWLDSSCKNVRFVRLANSFRFAKWLSLRSKAFKLGKLASINPSRFANWLLARCRITRLGKLASVNPLRFFSWLL